MSSWLKGGLMGGGLGCNIGVKGLKLKNFWKIVKCLFWYMFKWMLLIIVVLVLVIVVVVF